MPNNPLYPGHIEKKEGRDQTNPIYPGYYTGKPIPRRPQSKDFIKPIEFDIDTMYASIDEAAESVKNSPLNFPKWFKDRIVDDVKETLKASIRPKGISATELDEYGVEDLPSAFGVSLSLNPQDWKDPKSEAFKTLSSWMKTSIGIDPANPLKPNFSNIEDPLRKKLYLEVAYGDKGSTGKKLGWLEKTAKEAIEERTKTFGGGITGATDLNVRDVHVDLKTPVGRGNYKTERKNDIYGGAAGAIGDFEELKQNAKLRDSKHEDFVKKTAEGIRTETLAKYYDTQEKIQNTQNPSAHLNFLKNTLDNHEGAIKFFDIKTRTLEEMNNLGNSLENVKEGIEKSILNVNKEKQNKIFDFNNPKSWGRLEKSLKDTRTQTGSGLARLEEARSLLKQGKISEEGFKRFENILTAHDDYLSNVQETLNDLKKGNVPRKVALQRLKNIRGNGRDLKGGGGLSKNGIQRELAKNIQREISSTSADDIGSVLTDENLRSAGINFAGRKLIPFNNRLEQERIQLVTEELYDDLWDGKIPEKYLWNKVIKPKIDVFTPDSWISNRLKRSNYYGLIVGSDFDPEKRFKNPIKAAVWAKRHQYNFKMEFSKDNNFDRDFLQNWDIPGLKRNFLKLEGGKHYDILKDIRKAFDFDNPVDASTLKGLLGGAISLTIGKRADGSKFIQNIDQILLQKLRNKKFSDEDIIHFAENLKAYKDKLKELRKEFGNKVTDSDFQLDLLKKLDFTDKSLPGNYGITKRFAGRLDKIFVKLHDLSEKFKKTIFGKAVSITTSWRTLINEKIAALLTKFLTTAAASATGFLAVILPIIRGALKKTIQKALETFEKMFGALLRADFDKALDVLNENAKKALIGCIVVLLPPILIFSSIIYLVMALFGISISPVDPTTKSSMLLRERITYGELTAEEIAALGKDAVLPELDAISSEAAQLALLFASKLIRGENGGFNKLIDSNRFIWCTEIVDYVYNIIDPNWRTYLSEANRLSSSQIRTEIFEKGIDGYSYSEREDITMKQINPGDVLFFSGRGDDGEYNFHVAIVARVDEDSVATLESNSALVSYTLSADDNGHLSSATPYYAPNGLRFIGVGQYEGNEP